MILLFLHFLESGVRLPACRIWRPCPRPLEVYFPATVDAQLDTTCARCLEPELVGDLGGSVGGSSSGGDLRSSSGGSDLRGGAGSSGGGKAATKASWAVSFGGASNAGGGGGEAVEGVVLKPSRPSVALPKIMQWCEYRDFSTLALGEGGVDKGIYRRFFLSLDHLYVPVPTSA